ncbi:MAG: hypothetical protein LBU44_01550 [Mediterranea sp.]|jgi:hypothetical protein|nr:hypothetical protein [Mediterranea sp.]
MTTKYSDIVSLRGQKAAYNIEHEQSGDWTSFITNDQFNDILRKIIGSVRNNDADLHKSFWISGTYGAGKSHAGAVIKHLLCDSVENIVDYINEEYNDPKYEMLREDLLKLRERKRLFPVMLYGQSSIAHKEDLSIQLQRHITEALNNANIDIAVKTDFDNYIHDIKHDPDFWDSLIERNIQLKSATPTRKKLINDLKACNTVTLDKVRAALRERKKSINLPLHDISKWFFEVQHTLAKTTGYDGLLLIWDEFTDVMASEFGASLLVALQEIDEMIMNSGNNSYFFYISHPSAFNSFTNAECEKTKGRYHYMTYNMEPVSTFKIMSKKFIIKDSIKHFNLSQLFYEHQGQLLNDFSKSSANMEETKLDIRKLFPLHPSTVSLATYYAREVGSSSRSVFEFIGENAAIRHFLDSEECFEKSGTITADYLWDYVVDVFNSSVTKFGSVTERFNSHKLQVEAKGADHLVVFKSILLLNALNNIAGNEAVTPSEDNIENLFAGTSIKENLKNILNYFDENSIIQRLPGDLFSIQFSALPTKEIESIKEELKLTQYKYTSRIINFGDTAEKEFGIVLSGIARVNRFLFYSEDANECTLLNQIENGCEKANPYEVFMALLFARDANELNNLKEIASRASVDSRFQNMAFIVFENVFGNKNYERFIEYQANAICASKHNLTGQSAAHTKSASDMIKEWINHIRRGNFTCYLRGKRNVNAAIKIASAVNTCVSPVIFEHGAESLDIIKTKYSKTYWEKQYKEKAVECILSYNTKNDILKKCSGSAMHIHFLLQDSVDENLQWKDDMDENHPLYLVSMFVDNTFKQIDKNQPFNLGDKLIGLTKPPYGLYKSYAGMGMVAFAMRKYVKQIFDLNGKPREAQHLVGDIIEMFRTWEAKKSSNKLNFRFETKETRQLCESLIKHFKLNSLKGYNDISSLTDARWAITHEFSGKRGFPLWSLKYISRLSGEALPDGFKKLIDNVIKICGESDMRDPALITETLNGIEAYESEFGYLLGSPDLFKTGFYNFLRSIEVVNLQDNEMEEATAYLVMHLEETIGFWTENEVYDRFKDWRRNKDHQEKERKEEEERRKGKEGRKKKVDCTVYVQKRKSALRKVRKISSMIQAQKLFGKICEAGNEAILDLINNYEI